ncbi:MAG: hypothetical protein ACRDKI_12685, partial [Solirubrobacterales bacterium]
MSTSATKTSAALALVAAITALLAIAAVARAQTFSVDTASDSSALQCATPATADGDCSLRGAIIAANNTGAADTIDFSSSWGSIFINSPLPDVSAPVTISAVGRDVTVRGAY